MNFPFLQIFAVLAVSLSLGCSASLSDENADFGMARMHFLDVGQGLSILLEDSPQKAFALYDSGNDSAGFWDTLRMRGVRHLDWALVSHWHRDHAGGFLEWNGSVSIDTLFYGADTGGLWLRDSVLALAARYGTVARKVSRGTKIDCGAWSCRILWTPEFQTLGGNSSSAVLQISDGKSKALFTGDLERDGEAGLLEMSSDLQADLLQVGHHGSKGSSSLPFLERVAPRYAIVSVGKRNRYGHPAESTIRKLSFVLGDSSRIFRTDKDGSVTVEWKLGRGLWIRNY